MSGAIADSMPKSGNVMEALAKMQAEVRTLRMENAELKRENEALTLNVARLRMQLADHVPLPK